MKLIALGDTHGRDDWKEIVKDNPDADKIIFIGDYFDTHEGINGSVQLYNFKEIAEYKKSNMEKVVLLIGNHDFHYLTPERERYSGFQDMYAVDIREAVSKAIREGLLQMCYSYNKYLFVHAGVTKTWYKAQNIDVSDDISTSINELFSQKLTPFYFTVGKSWNPYGDDVTQTPIWVRPLSLSWDAIDGFTQVVGHTTQMEIVVDEKMILIDTIGTSGQYLEISDGVVIVRTKPYKPKEF